MAADNSFELKLILNLREAESALSQFQSRMKSGAAAVSKAAALPAGPARTTAVGNVQAAAAKDRGQVLGSLRHAQAAGNITAAEYNKLKRAITLETEEHLKAVKGLAGYDPKKFQGQVLAASNATVKSLNAMAVAQGEVAVAHKADAQVVKTGTAKRKKASDAVVKADEELERAIRKKASEQAKARRATGGTTGDPVAFVREIKKTTDPQLLAEQMRTATKKELTAAEKVVSSKNQLAVAQAAAAETTRRATNAANKSSSKQTAVDSENVTETRAAAKKKKKKADDDLTPGQMWDSAFDRGRVEWGAGDEVVVANADQAKKTRKSASKKEKSSDAVVEADKEVVASSRKLAKANNDAAAQATTALPNRATKPKAWVEAEQVRRARAANQAWVKAGQHQWDEPDSRSIWDDTAREFGYEPNRGKSGIHARTKADDKRDAERAQREAKRDSDVAKRHEYDAGLGPKDPSLGVFGKTGTTPSQEAKAKLTKAEEERAEVGRRQVLEAKLEEQSQKRLRKAVNDAAKALEARAKRADLREDQAGAYESIPTSGARAGRNKLGQSFALPEPGTQHELDKLLRSSKKDLYARAQAVNLPGRSKMSRTELYEALDALPAGPRRREEKGTFGTGAEPVPTGEAAHKLKDAQSKRFVAEEDATRALTQATKSRYITTTGATPQKLANAEKLSAEALQTDARFRQFSTQEGRRAFLASLPSGTIVADDLNQRRARPRSWLRGDLRGEPTGGTRRIIEPDRVEEIRGGDGAVTGHRTVKGRILEGEIRSATAAEKAADADEVRAQAKKDSERAANRVLQDEKHAATRKKRGEQAEVTAQAEIDKLRKEGKELTKRDMDRIRGQHRRDFGADPKRTRGAGDQGAADDRSKGERAYDAYVKREDDKLRAEKKAQRERDNKERIRERETGREQRRIDKTETVIEEPRFGPEMSPNEQAAVERARKEKRDAEAKALLPHVGADEESQVAKNARAAALQKQAHDRAQEVESSKVKPEGEEAQEQARRDASAALHGKTAEERADKRTAAEKRKIAQQVRADERVIKAEQELAAAKEQEAKSAKQAATVEAKSTAKKVAPAAAPPPPPPTDGPVYGPDHPGEDPNERRKRLRREADARRRAAKAAAQYTPLVLETVPPPKDESHWRDDDGKKPKIGKTAVVDAQRKLDEARAAATADAEQGARAEKESAAAAKKKAATEKSRLRNAENVAELERRALAEAAANAQVKTKLAQSPEYAASTRQKAEAEAQLAAQKSAEVAIARTTTATNVTDAQIASQVAQTRAEEKNALRQRVALARAHTQISREELALEAQGKILDQQMNAERKKMVVQLAKEQGLFKGGTRVQNVEALLQTKQTGEFTPPQSLPTGGALLGGGLLRTAKYALSAAILFGTLATIKSIVEESEKLERVFNQIERQFTSIGQADQFAGFRDGILEIARETGVAGERVATFAFQLKGAFGNLDTSEVLSYAEDGAKIMQVTGLSIEEVTDSLTAASKAFNVDFGQIGDVAIVVQEKFGVLAKETIKFLGDIAPVAKAANLTLEETAALAGVAQQASGRSGSSLAEAFGRILPALSSAGPKLLELRGRNPGFDVSPESVALGQTGAILKDVIEGYDKLSQTEKNYLIEQLGGRREAQALITVLEHKGDVLQALGDAQSNAGKLDEYFGDLQETLAQKVARLGEKFRQLGRSVYESGFADVLKTIIELGGLVIGVLQGVGGAFGFVNEALGGWIGKVLFGALAFKGFLAVVKASRGLGEIAGALRHGAAKAVATDKAAIANQREAATNLEVGTSAEAAAVGTRAEIVALETEVVAANAATVANERLAVSRLGLLNVVSRTPVGQLPLGGRGPTDFNAPSSYQPHLPYRAGPNSPVAVGGLYAPSDAGVYGNRAAAVSQLYTPSNAGVYGNTPAAVAGLYGPATAPSGTLAARTAAATRTGAAAARNAAGTIISGVGGGLSRGLHAGAGAATSTFGALAKARGTIMASSIGRMLVEGIAIGAAIYAGTEVFKKKGEKRKQVRTDEQAYKEALKGATDEQLRGELATNKQRPEAKGWFKPEQWLEGALFGNKQPEDLVKDEQQRRRAPKLTDQLAALKAAGKIKAEDAEKLQAGIDKFDDESIKQVDEAVAKAKNDPKYKTAFAQNTADREAGVRNVATTAAGEAAIKSADQAKALFEAGQISAPEYIAVLKQQLASLDEAAAVPGASQEIKDAHAQAGRLVAEQQSKFLRAQVDGINAISEAVGTNTPEAQVQRLMGLLRNPEFKGRAERASAVSDLLGAYKSILATKANLAETATERLAILQEGIAISPEAQFEILYTQLGQFSNTWHLFLVTAFGSVNNLANEFTKTVAWLAFTSGKTIAEATIIVLTQQRKAVEDVLKNFPSGAIHDGMVRQLAIIDAQIAAANKDLSKPGDLPGAPPKKVEGSAEEKKAARDQARTEATALRQAQYAVVQANRSMFDAVHEANPIAIGLSHVAAADEAIKAAQADERDAKTAAEKLTAKAAVISAQAQRIQAQHELQNAMRDIMHAQFEIVQALYNYAGNTVGAAQAALDQAISDLNYLRSDPNSGEADKKRAEAAVINAMAAQRDAALQEKLSDEAFLYDMGKVSTSEYIKYLKTLLDIPTLTKQQRQDIERQIHNLRKSLTDFQFDIPSELQLPTLYEVRRYNQSSAAGQGYQDNRNININIVANNTLDAQQALNAITDALSGQSRYGVASTLY